MMDESLLHLIRAQETDVELVKLKQAIAALPRHLAAIEEKLQTQKTVVANAEKSIQAEETKRRRIESDIKDQQQKIVKFRDQSASVKTNDQFHALQHEISFAEKEISRLEDTELEGMERSEQLETTLKQAKQELASQTEFVEHEKDYARRKTTEQQEQLAKLEETRKTLRSQVEETLLADYDRIASTRGTGLARVQEQRCLACQMALRPQVWNQVRAGQRIHCESCGRIFYFDESLERGIEQPIVEPSKRKRKFPETTESGS